MLRALIVGAVTLMECSDALAQSCTGNPVAVQVLGSGAPGFVKDRAFVDVENARRPARSRACAQQQLQEAQNNSDALCQRVRFGA